LLVTEFNMAYKPVFIRWAVNAQTATETLSEQVRYRNK
jgi:hypothetical protein